VVSRTADAQTEQKKKKQKRSNIPSGKDVLGFFG
jgi:hypothetical protein